MKKRSIEAWGELIQSCQASPLPVKEWCQANPISYSAYYYWFTKINKRKKVEGIQWLQVSMPAPPKKEVGLFCLQLTYKQIPLEIKDCTRDVFGEILKTLESIC